MQRIKNLITEMIPVILGILIALLVNNWKESLDDRRFLDRVLSSIRSELQENQTELETMVTEHASLYDTIGIYMDDQTVSIGDILRKVNGLRGSSIKNTAWKSFLNNNIQLVDYELISVLTDIEEGKQDMKLMISKIMDVLYNKLDSRNSADKQLFLIITGDLLSMEDALLEYHRRFLKLDQ